MSAPPATSLATFVRQMFLLSATGALFAGCEAFHSDSENFSRQRTAELRERVAGMRVATQQTPKGASLSGPALVALLSGKTHVSVFETFPDGRRGRYVEYRYYRPDGRFVFLAS